MELAARWSGSIPAALAAAPAGTSPASAQPSPDAAELTRAEQRGNSEPTAALSDIEQADPQRRALEILVLVQLGRVGHARALADRFYRDFPGSPEIPQIERVTGYHPRPYAPHTSPSN